MCHLGFRLLVQRAGQSLSDGLGERVVDSSGSSGGPEPEPPGAQSGLPPWGDKADLRKSTTGYRDVPPQRIPPGVVRRGVCCSGGGIRSAAFNLGALQSLDARPESGEPSVLEDAEYLSAVSGGAYIATGYTAARLLERTDNGAVRYVEPGSGDSDGDGREEDSDPSMRRRSPTFSPGSGEERWLRNRTRYLVPEKGGYFRALATLTVGAAWIWLIVLSFVVLVGVTAGGVLAWSFESLRVKRPEPPCGVEAETEQASDSDAVSVDVSSAGRVEVIVDREVDDDASSVSAQYGSAPEAGGGCAGAVGTGECRLLQEGALPSAPFTACNFDRLVSSWGNTGPTAARLAAVLLAAFVVGDWIRVRIGRCLRKPRGPAGGQHGGCWRGACGACIVATKRLSPDTQALVWVLIVTTVLCTAVLFRAPGALPARLAAASVVLLFSAVVLFWWASLGGPKRAVGRGRLRWWSGLFLIVSLLGLFLFVALPWTIWWLRWDLPDIAEGTGIWGWLASLIERSNAEEPAKGSGWLFVLGSLGLLSALWGAILALLRRQAVTTLKVLAWIVPVVGIGTAFLIAVGRSTTWWAHALNWNGRFDGPPEWPWQWSWTRGTAGWLIVAVCLGIIVAAWSLGANATSLHYFYKRQLANAYFVGRDGTGATAEFPWDHNYDLSELAGAAGFPDLVICAAANLTDPHMNPPGRNASSFTFSPTEVGGPQVGYSPACLYSVVAGRDATLPAAMAVSGAAFAPTMGKMTEGSVRLLLFLMNLRLGLWLPSPETMGQAGEAVRRKQEADAAPKEAEGSPEDAQDDAFGAASEEVDAASEEVDADSEEADADSEAAKRAVLVADGRARKDRLGSFWREMRGHHPRLGCRGEDHPNRLYVTDGGHWENLGLVELLRRGCTEIYCFDASGDDVDSFFTLGEAIALARTELGVEIDIDPREMAPRGGSPQPESKRAKRRAVKGDPGDGKEEAEPRKSERSPAVCVGGTFTYPNGVQGKLVVAKLAVTDAMPWDVRAYADADDKFPTHSTSEQLYTDKRFEAYRALGRFAAWKAVKKMDSAYRRPKGWVFPASGPKSG